MKNNPKQESLLSLISSIWAFIGCIPTFILLNIYKEQWQVAVCIICWCVYVIIGIALSGKMSRSRIARKFLLKNNGY